MINKQGLDCGIDKSVGVVTAPPSFSPNLLVITLCTLIVSGCGNSTSVAEPDESAPTNVPGSIAERCAQTDSELGITRPAGWEPLSHCKFAPFDQEVVFPSDRVTKMTIKIENSEYQAMQADLADLFSGSGTQLNGQSTDSEDLDAILSAACDGLAADNACSVDLGAGAEPGMCADLNNMLMCIPNSSQSGTELGGTDTVDANENTDSTPTRTSVDPCAGSSNGSVCTLRDATGSCTATTGPLICEVDSFEAADVSGVPIEFAASFYDRKPSYFHADIDFEGVTYTDVGIRYKGNSSLQPDAGGIHPLRIKADEWEDENASVDDQRIFGFQALSLAPTIQDPSRLRQVVAAEAFRESNVPAPLAGFVEVSVDSGSGPQLLGLYAMTEIPDKALLDREFENNDGNLYKPDGRGAHFLTFIEGSWHEKSNEDSTFEDAQAFINALHASREDRPNWRENLDKTFNVNAFIEATAVNQIIANWDTYGFLAHNFYLYTDEATEQLTLIPWDFDLSFAQTNADGILSMDLHSAGGKWPLLQAIARDSDFATRYQSSLRTLSGNLVESGLINDRIDHWAAIIRPSIAREQADGSGDANTMTAFDAGVVEIRDNLASRHSEVQAFLESQVNQDASESSAQGLSHVIPPSAFRNELSGKRLLELGILKHSISVNQTGSE